MTGPLLLTLALSLLLALDLRRARSPQCRRRRKGIAAAAAANLPLTTGLQFVVAPLLIGLSVGASVFSWRELSRTDLRIFETLTVQAKPRGASVAMTTLAKNSYPRPARLNSV